MQLSANRLDTQQVIYFPVPMEPIKHTLTTRFRSLRMYRNELDELVSMFASSCSTVVISDQDHRYDSLDEMKHYVGRRIVSLDIVGCNPAVHFLVNRTEQVRFSAAYPPGEQRFNELRTEEISEDAEALFFRVKDFLNRCQRPIAPDVFLVGLVMFSIPGAALLGMIYGLNHNEVDWMATILASSVVFLLAFMILLERGNYLVLDTRLESPSFFVRYRDEFARHAITTVISAIVAGIVGYLVGHFLK